MAAALSGLAHKLDSRIGASARKRETRATRDLVREIHRRRCVRGYGFLRQRSTGEYYPAPCRDWRECEVCARAYGKALSERWSRVKGLLAFVVLTMPPGVRERWNEKAAVDQMMAAWHRLYERLCRRFDRRPKAMHFKEHAGQWGGLHLNVLWDFDWIDQAELAEMAAECGMGSICWISAIRADSSKELVHGRAGSSPAVRYSMKEGFRVRAYARKTGNQTKAGDDWPRWTRRWSASRAASGDMGVRTRNPDWGWTAVEPKVELPRLVTREYYVLPGAYLPCRPASSAATTEPRPPPPLQVPLSFLLD